MSRYKITQHTLNQAKKLNVEVKPSKLKNKKIDVFDKKGKKLASVGDINYGDYGTFIKTKGQEYANTRRRLYRIRHGRFNNKTKHPRAYYAYNLLW